MTDLIAMHDVFIPLAALVGVPLCSRDAIGTITTNRDSIRLLCSKLSPSQWILMLVTNSGYGIGQPGVPCTEESPLKLISLYGTSKVEAEQAVLERENSISFRLATVFGMAPPHAARLACERFRLSRRERPRAGHLRGPFQAELHPHPRCRPRLPPCHRKLRDHARPRLQCGFGGCESHEVGALRRHPKTYSRFQHRSARMRTSAITSSRTNAFFPLAGNPPTASTTAFANSSKATASSKTAPTLLCENTLRVD